MDLLLWIERDITGSGAQGGGEIDPFNLVFIVFFALFISWLAIRLSGRGGRGGRGKK